LAVAGFRYFSIGREPAEPPRPAQRLAKG